MGRFRIGVAAGIIATVGYDLSKYALSQWDRSPYDPFEAIRIFGVLLAGSAAPAAIIITAGVAYHVLNGVTFAVAFCFLFGERGVTVGILWGLFLETFQLALFPGWLDMRFFQEFLQISFLAHVVYGAILGLVCRHQLQRSQQAGSR